MRKEAQAIEVIKQAALLTVNHYGREDILGNHLLELLTGTADTIGSHFEVLYAYRSYEYALRESAPAPPRRITEADARLTRDVITRLCRNSLDVESILNYIEAADYISECCVRMSAEEHITA